MPTPLAESMELLSSQALPGNYTRLLLRAPQSVAALQPGQYLSSPQISMDASSGCMPVMSVQGENLECLYRNPANGEFPPTLQDHERLTATLRGDGWNLDGESHIVFLAQNEGLACVVHAASRLRRANFQKTLTAMLEFDDSPPFTPKPSQILLPGAPAEAVACVPLLEDWGIASRLADPGDRQIPKPGWFSGTAAMLAGIWFEQTFGGNCLLVCCGNRNFVNAASKLADHWRLPLESTILPKPCRTETSV